MEMQNDKKPYVTPDITLFEVRAEERFTNSFGSCDFDLNGTVRQFDNAGDYDTLIVSGMAAYARTNPVVLAS